MIILSLSDEIENLPETNFSFFLSFMCVCVSPYCDTFPQVRACATLPCCFRWCLLAFLFLFFCKFLYHIQVLLFANGRQFDLRTHGEQHSTVKADCRFRTCRHLQSKNKLSCFGSFFVRTHTNRITTLRHCKCYIDTVLLLPQWCRWGRALWFQSRDQQQWKYKPKPRRRRL
jgi:hypothetical protein